MTPTPSSRYGSDLIRPGLLPGLLCSAACIVGLWASGTPWMLTVLFVVSILSAILAFFCLQAARTLPRPATRNRAAERDGRPLAIVLLIFTAGVAILYNPIYPFVLTASGTLWQLVQVFSGACTFAAGVLVKTRSRTE